MKEKLKKLKKEFDTKVKGDMILEQARKSVGIKKWKHPKYSDTAPHAFVDLFYKFLLKNL